MISTSPMFHSEDIKTIQHQIVMPWFGPEPKFEPEPWGTWPKVWFKVQKLQEAIGIAFRDPMPHLHNPNPQWLIQYFARSPKLAYILPHLSVSENTTGYLILLNLWEISGNHDTDFKHFSTCNIFCIVMHSTLHQIFWNLAWSRPEPMSENTSR